MLGHGEAGSRLRGVTSMNHRDELNRRPGPGNKVTGGGTLIFSLGLAFDKFGPGFANLIDGDNVRMI